MSSAPIPQAELKVTVDQGYADAQYVLVLCREEHFGGPEWYLTIATRNDEGNLVEAEEVGGDGSLNRLLIDAARWIRTGSFQPAK